MKRLLIATVTGWTRRRSANVGTLILALANAAISYDALAAAARAAGLPWFLSWLFPLATDGIIAVATPAQLELRDRDAPAWVRAQIGVLLWAAIVFSVIGNASRASKLWTGAHLYWVPVPTWNAVWLALPPLAYAGALHVLGLVHRYPAPAEPDAAAEAARLREELAEARRSQTEAPAAAPASADVLASTAAAGAEHARELPAGRPEPPPDDTPSGGRRAPKRASKARSGRAREQAPRLRRADVKALVESAREHVLANADRPAERALDELVAEHLSADGHPLSRSRVRTYLAELRRDSTEPGAAPARRPRLVHLEAEPAAASAHAQEA